MLNSVKKIVDYSSIPCRGSSTICCKTSGDELHSVPEVAVLPSQPVPTRKVTPKQLSMAVSKRKKVSRAGVTSLDEESKEKEEEPPKRKKKRLSNRWNFRYDKIPIPERNELVDHVTNKLGRQLSITRPFQDAYTSPSVIGMDSIDVDNIYEEMLRAGFKESDAASILPYLPSCLTVDYTSLRQMCDLLVENGIGWRPFLRDHCHCLIQPVAIVKANIIRMKEMGMTVQVIGCVLRSQPMLFTCHLNPEHVTTIMDTKALGFNSAWADSTVKQALLNRPAKVTLGSDVKKINHILHQFKVSPDYVLRKSSSFFKLKASDLLSVLEVLCGQPLYLDSTLIALILTSCPHCVTSIGSIDELKSHLSSLVDILTVTSSIQYIVRHISRTPLLISPTLMVKDKVSFFKDVGFTTEQISIICNRAPSILTQTTDELQTRFGCLLKLEGSSLSALSTAASSAPSTIRARFLTIQISDLQARMNYCSLHKPELLSIEKLDELFGTTDHQFAKMLGKTAVQYLNHAVDHKWLDKKVSIERIGRLRKSSHEVEDSDRVEEETTDDKEL